MPAAAPGHGVTFRSIDGRRSSAATGRAGVAAAAQAVDASLAARVSAEQDWRGHYHRHLRDLTAASASSAAATVSMAAAGLESLYGGMVVVDGDAELGLVDAVRRQPRTVLGTHEVHGVGERERVLTVRAGTRVLRGADLLARLGAWERAGVLEPTAADAVREVEAHPEWLDLRGRGFALLGAGAELAPLEPLLRWGATVHAVDVRRPGVWQRLVDLAAPLAGRLLVPVRSAAGDRDGDAVADRAGADLLTEVAEVRHWLTRGSEPLVLGTYVYADSADFLRVALAADAVMTAVLDAGLGAGLATLATPTDVFVVPWDAVSEGRRRYSERGWRRPAQVPLRVLSGQRLFRPSYPSTLHADDGRELGVSDCLVRQQGPNYALAKQAQRWRSTVCASAGRLVSANVAPPTQTRSVLKNPVLARAYAGARRFGVETFAPETSRDLMAALLVHDLHVQQSAQGHDLYAEGAVHGGLWRVAYEPRSVLGLAVGVGAIARARTSDRNAARVSGFGTM